MGSMAFYRVSQQPRDNVTLRNENIEDRSNLLSQQNIKLRGVNAEW